MARVLIVDDDESVRAELREYLEFAGHVIFEAADGMQAVTLSRENDYDLITMDVMMPKLDGFSAVKEIRKIKHTPIIMLSARKEEYDKLFGFEMGADDYVTKPFSPKEIEARIEAILKRGKQTPKRVISEGLDIDISGRSVYVDGKRATLTPKEYELLFYLVSKAGEAVSRENLLSEVWGYDFYGDDRTVDTHIKMLRASMGKYRDKIITLRGIGYKLEL